MFQTNVRPQLLITRSGSVWSYGLVYLRDPGSGLFAEEYHKIMVRGLQQLEPYKKSHREWLPIYL
jgi:hypothetical protein